MAVADVYLGSPAYEADLQPFKDFILGTRELTFDNLQAFAKYVQINKNREIHLYIYNVDREQVRLTSVTPRDNWSGEGLLGADISFGFLNRLPMRKKDIANEQKANKMKSIFGGIGGQTQGSRFEPTYETCSSDEESVATKQAIKEEQAASQASN